MKASLPYFLFFLILFGCKNEDKLTFESLVIENGPCPDCPNVSITIPKVIERTKLAKTINTALQDAVITLLLFDDDIEASTIEEAQKSFKSAYIELKELFAEETTPWEAKVDGTIAYEDKNRLTIELRSYIFTGGAHGYNSIKFLTFDKKKAQELENWELFKDQKAFESFAETKFRVQEAIPLDQPINSTGFMFENEIFYLPENIGFTKDGVQLLYNQYEVASYADGPIILTLPYAEVKNYLTLQTGL